jgi:hypothetical protein
MAARAHAAAILGFGCSVALIILNKWIETGWGTQSLAVFNVLLAIVIVASLFVCIYPSKPVRGNKMIPLIGMAVCAFGLVGFGAWYFWPEAKAEDATEMASGDKQEDSISIDQSINAPNNQGVINQQNNNVINQAPPPEVKWGPKRESQNGQNFRTEYEFEVVAASPVNAIWFEVYGHNVRELDVMPSRPGVHFKGASGQRDTHAFTTIQNALGKYTLTVLSDGPATKFTYGYE